MASIPGLKTSKFISKEVYNITGNHVQNFTVAEYKYLISRLAPYLFVDKLGLNVHKNYMLHMEYYQFIQKGKGDTKGYTEACTRYIQRCLTSMYKTIQLQYAYKY